MRKLRAYNLNTYSKLDAVLLEDRLHNYVHAEAILESTDRDTKSERKLLSSGIEKSTGIAPHSGNGNLYGILRLNEFDVEEKIIKRLRLWKRGFPWIFPSNIFPTHTINLLLSGEEMPLIAIHDFLINDPAYLVLSAKDVEKANWIGQTRVIHSHNFIQSYITELTKYLDKNFNDVGKSITPTLDRTTHQYGATICLTGEAWRILQLRKELKTGFYGEKIEQNEISYF